MQKSPLAEWMQKHDRKQREALATSCECSVGYLYLLAGGHRTPSLKRAKKIEIHTGGAVPIDSYLTDEDMTAA